MPQLATFHIGDQTFAIDILLTKEIGKIHEITIVPETPEYVVGLMNLRGQILTIMDPSMFLDRNKDKSIEEQRLIILKTTAELRTLEDQTLYEKHQNIKDPLAILIDEMGDVLEVDNNDITPPPSSLAGIKREFVAGIIQLEKKLVIVLNVDRLVAIWLQPDASVSTLN